MWANEMSAFTVCAVTIAKPCRLSTLPVVQVGQACIVAVTGEMLRGLCKHGQNLFRTVINVRFRRDLESH